MISNQELLPTAVLEPITANNCTLPLLEFAAIEFDEKNLQRRLENDGDEDHPTDDGVSGEFVTQLGFGDELRVGAL